MRTFVLAAFAAVTLLAFTARADDTKPPAISDVKASISRGKVQIEARITDETGVLSAIVHHRGAGGKVEDTAMTKNDYDDVFKATFSGSGDTEYWIESSDLLGNGPSTYGSAGKAFTASGKPGKGGGTSVATREPPPRHEEPPKEEPQPKEEPEKVEHREHHARPAAKAEEPPVIEHRAPGGQPPEGRDFTVRMKIKSASPVAVAVMTWRQQGAPSMTTTRLSHSEGDSWEGVIPGAQAKGKIEYFIAAKNEAGQLTKQGDGDSNTPYVMTFKGAAVSAGGGTTSTTTASAEPAKAAGPYQFSHLPLYRVQPGKPIVVRAQIVPSAEGGELPEHTAILWRGNDAQDQFTEMAADPTGGYGGVRVELPAQDEGAIFYQIIACDGAAKVCGADTGSKRKWHSAMVSAQPGGAQPMPLDAVSSKAPPALPE
jgi:hypothetical protein